MGKLTLVGLALLIAFSGSLAGQKEFLFQKGNKLYEEGRYEEAIQAYQKILDMGYESSELYYNLGNAYFKKKDIGRAILYYERAKKLSPEDEDVKFNLRLANLRVVDKITLPPQFFLFKIISDFKNLFTLDQLAVTVLILYSMAITVSILKILIRKRPIQRLSSLLIPPVIFFLIVFSIVFGVRIHEAKTHAEAIILAEKVEVRSSPQEEGIELFFLHEGTKVKIEEISGEWVKISLPDGKVGWVKGEVLEKI